MVWLVAMVAVGQQAGGFYSQVVPRTTGKNGYEEYVHAAVLVSSPEVRRWEATVPPFAPGLDANSTRLERNQWVTARLKIALDLIHQGNAKPVTEPRETYGYSTLLPELTHFRQLSKLLAGAAYADFAAGRSGQGTERLLDSLVFGDNVSRTGTLLSHLVGVAQLSIAFASFESRLPQLSKEDCRRVVQTTTALLERPSAYASVLETERGLSLKALSELLDGKESWVSESEYRGFSKVLQEKSPSEREEIRRLATQIINDQMGPAIQAYRGPESRWPIQGEALPILPARMPTNPEGLAEALVDSIAPVSTQGGMASLRSRTQMRLLRLHAWVLAYRWEHDRLPTRLADAVPQDALIDPANGQPFEYTITEGGYKLHSLGRDGTGEIALRYKIPPQKPGPNDPPR